MQKRKIAFAVERMDSPEICVRAAEVDVFGDVISETITAHCFSTFDLHDKAVWKTVVWFQFASIRARV